MPLVDAFMNKEENDDRNTALTIFRDLKDTGKHVLELVNKLKSRVSSQELNADNGISLLELKNHLMIQYLLNLAQVVILKISGKLIEEDKCLDRLIELRIILERINPLEQKLRYHIEKLIKIALSGKVDENDSSRYRANPLDMLEDEAGSGSENVEENSGKEKQNSNVYVPPKLAAVPYEGDESQNERKQKMYDRARRQALRSSVIQELKEEYLDVPIEVKATNTAKQKEDKYQEMKREYEETYFTRLPVTKEEKKRAKLISSMGRLGDDITHFEDTSILHNKVNLNEKKRKFSGKKGKGRKKRRH